MIRIHAERARRALRGAALVALSALGLAACESDTAPPFEVEGEGSISGLLYYDAGRDGLFQPLDGDYALAGVPVWLQVRGTNQIVSGTETVTDAQGRFTISNVPIGTHDLMFDADVLDGVAVVCNSPREVSVRISEVTAVTISGQESCLIPIAEAREQPVGTPITVRGVVTIASGQISSGYFWIQDETAGIRVNIPTNAQVGQFIEVQGPIGVSFGETLVSGGTTSVLGTAEVPDPIVLTGAELLSSEYQGSLATVLGVVVTNILVGVGGGDNITVRAPDDRVFLIRADYDTGVTQGTAFTVGNTYNVSGVVSPFGGAEQIYVRGNSDIVLVP